MKITTVLSFCIAILWATSAFAQSDVTVCFQPLGKYNKSALASAERGVTYLYGFKTEILAAKKFPKKSWYQPRKRWKADRILDHFEEINARGTVCTIVVGFTREDISVENPPHKDWGVLGLGQISGRYAVVSTFRMRKRLKKPNSLNRRAIKVVNHEIGHVLGLPHTPVKGCLMQDAEGSVSSIDGETGTLCKPTIQFIEKKFQWTLPIRQSIEWSKIE